MSSTLDFLAVVKAWRDPQLRCMQSQWQSVWKFFVENPSRYANVKLTRLLCSFTGNWLNVSFSWSPFLILHDQTDEVSVFYDRQILTSQSSADCIFYLELLLWRIRFLWLRKKKTRFDRTLQSDIMKLINTRTMLILGDWGVASGSFVNLSLMIFLRDIKEGNR